MKKTLKGPAKDLNRTKEKRCEVSARSLHHELILIFTLENGEMIRFGTDDAQTIDHIADVARMAKNRAKRN